MGGKGGGGEIAGREKEARQKSKGEGGEKIRAHETPLLLNVFPRKQVFEAAIYL